jgi:hypothetical protein
MLLLVLVWIMDIFVTMTYDALGVEWACKVDITDGSVISILSISTNELGLMSTSLRAVSIPETEDNRVIIITFP